MAEDERLVPYRLGCAKILFDNLTFIDAIGAHRLPQFDAKRVERLASDFKVSGLDRENKDHFIKAMGPSNQCARAGLTNNANIQHLSIDFTLCCFQGRHRIEAAKKVLRANDRWWVVEIYAEEELAEDLQWELATYIVKGTEYSDGFIYTQLRELANNATAKGKWLALLTKKGRQSYVQLCTATNDAFRQALDRLLVFPGLWVNFTFGVLERIMRMRCAAEISHYLGKVYEAWSSIALNRAELFPSVDIITVRAVELLSPAYSRSDCRKIISLVQEKTIFHNVDDPDVRSAIEAALLAQSRLPSLSSFLDDTLFLAYGVKIVKRFLPIRLTGTQQVKGALQFHYNGQSFEFAYRSLWLAALRNFTQLLSVTAKKGADGSTAEVKEPNGRHWRDMAIEAHQLGFRSPDIDKFMVRDYEAIAAQELVEKFRPGIDQQISRTVVNQIASLLKQLPGLAQTPKTTPPDMSTCLVDLSVTHRAGVPSVDSFASVQSQLIYGNVFSRSHSFVLNDFPTSFAMLKNTIQSFFGFEIQEASSTYSSPRESPRPAAGLGPNVGQTILSLQHPRASTYSVAPPPLETPEPGRGWTGSADASSLEQTPLQHAIEAMEEFLRYLAQSEDIFAFDCCRGALFSINKDNVDDNTISNCFNQWRKRNALVWTIHETSKFAAQTTGSLRIESTIKEIEARGGVVFVKTKDRKKLPDLWSDVLCWFQEKKDIHLADTQARAASDYLRSHMTKMLNQSHDLSRRQPQGLTLLSFTKLQDLTDFLTDNPEMINPS